MGKRFWAMWIKRLLLSLVVVFIAGMLIDYFSADYPEQRQPLAAGFFALGFYIAAIVIIMILDAVSGALYLWLFADKDMTDAFLNDLREMKLPAPESYHPKNFDYLGRLADDESEEANDRVKAAFLAGSYKTAMQHGLFRSLAIRKAIDAAVLRYSQEAPQR